MKKITIAEAQKLRTQGYNIITNRNFTKVIRYSKSELKIENKNERIYGAMIRITYTVEQQKAAWATHCKINKI
jgi:hypothetical protein|tara:strand:+ start:1159 stop:1377 length:219 start_codon:yes stop_codon:yes gene_type:complete